MSGRPEALAGAVATAERLAELTEQKATLARKLGDSLALEQFAGRPIFESGAVRSYVTGNPWSPERATFHLELASGESLEWPLADVPVRFWRGFADTLLASRSEVGRAFARKALGQ